LYENLIICQFFFQIINKENKTPYARKLNLIFFDDKNIEYPERFVRHLKSYLKNEKIPTGLDKNLQKIESYLKGLNRMLVVGELPNLIEKSSEGDAELNRLRILVDIISGMKK
jgi:hypothetical protein